MAKALNVSVSVTADTGQAKAALQDLQNSLTQLRSGGNLSLGNLGLNANEIQQASQAVIDLQAHLKAATNVNTGTLNFAKLSTSLKAAKVDIADYGAQLLKLGPQGQQAFSQLTKSIANAEIPVNKLSTLMGNFGTVLKNTIRWQISSSMIHGFIGSIQSAFRYAQDLNESLNNIQIVTGKSNNEMALFAESANKAAKELSTTTTRYTDASLIYYQQGIRDQKEIDARTRATIKMANVTGQSAETVSNQMTAIWNNFAKGGQNLEYYADVITALGAATASSSAEISTGLSKFAAIADTVGLSYENATAALATITATTRQSADSVGTGLRTLFARLQSLSLGETLEDGVNLTKYTKALQTVGVSALDASGNLRAMDDILNDLGQQWGKLSNAQRTALAQTVGGIRQYTTLMALMENFDFYQENVGIAQNSQGTLQKQQEIYEKSWEASNKRVKASAETIYSSLLNDQFFIKMNNGFSGFLDIINQLITGLGGVKGILLTVGTVATTIFKDSMTRKLYNFTQGLKMFFTPSSDFVKQRNDTLESLINLAVSPNTSTSTVNKQQEFYRQSLESAQWYAMNKDKMTPFQQYQHQFMQQTIEANNAYYDQTIARRSEAIDNLSDASGNIYTTAKAAWQTAQEAQKIYSKYASMGRENLSDKEFEQFQRYTKQGVFYQRNGTYRFNSAYQNLSQITKQEDFNTSFQKDFAKVMSESYATSIKDLLTSYTNSSEYKNATDEAARASNLGKFFDSYLKSYTDLNRDAVINQLKAGGQDVSNNIDKIVKDYKMSLGDMSISDFSEKYQIAGQDLEFYIQKLSEAKQAALDQSQAEEYATQALQKKKEMEQQNAVLMKSQQQFTAITGAIMSTGMAIVQLNGFWNQLNAAIEGTGDASQVLMSGLIAIPMVITSISGALQGLAKAGIFGAALTGKGFTGMALGGWTTAAIAAIVAIIAAIKLIDKAIETPKEKLERLNKEAEEAQNKAKEAQQAYDNFINNKSQRSTLLDSIKELTKGTQEYINKIKEANDITQDMISGQGLTYGTDYWYDEDGILQLSEDATEKVEKSLEKQKDIIKKVASFANLELETYQSEQATEERTEELQAQRRNIGKLFSGMDYGDYTQKDSEYLLNSTGKWTNEQLSAMQTGTYLAAAQVIGFQGSSAEEILTSLLEESISLIAEKGPTAIMDELGLQAQSLYNDFKNSGLDNVVDYVQQIVTQANEVIPTMQGNADNLVQVAATIAKLNGQEISEDFIVATRDSIVEIQGEEARGISTLLPSFESILVQMIGEEQSKSTYFGNKYAESFAMEDMLEIFPSLYKELSKAAADIDTLMKNEDMSLIDMLTSELGIDKLGSEYFKTNGSYDFEKIASDLKGIKQWDMVQSQLNTVRQQYLGMAQTGGYDWNNTSNWLNAASVQKIRNNENINERYQKLASDLYVSNLQSFIETLTSSFKDVENSSDIVSSIATMEDWTVSDMGKISRLVKTLGTFGGPNTLTRLADKLSAQNLERLLSIEGEKPIDWLFNALQISGLTKDESIAAIAGGLLQDMGGTSGLFEEIFKTEEFSKSLADLQKDLSKTGRAINMQDIETLAKSSTYLQQALDNNLLSGGAIRQVLQMYTSGSIDSIDQVSNALWDAFKAASELDDSLKSVYDHISEFSSAKSISTIGSFYKGLSDQIQDSWEKGMVLDPALLQAWEEIFGKESAAAYKKEVESLSAAGKSVKDIIETLKDSTFKAETVALKSIEEFGDMRGVFEYLAGADGKGKKQVYQAEDENGNVGSLFRYNKDNTVTVANEEELAAHGWDTREGFVKALMKSGQVSQSTAESMVSELISTNAGLSYIFTKGAVKQGVGALAKGTGYDLETGKGGILTQDDIDKYWSENEDILKEIYGSKKKYREALKKQAKENDALILENKEFLESEDHSRQNLINKVFGGSEKALNEALTKVGGKSASEQTINELASSYQKLGLNAEEAYQAIDDGIKAGKTGEEASKAMKDALEAESQSMDQSGKKWERFQKYIEDAGKSMDEVSSKDWSEFLEYDAATEQARQSAQIMADTFTSAFKDLTIEIEFSADLKSFIARIKEDLEEEKIEVPVEGEGSGGGTGGGTDGGTGRGTGRGSNKPEKQFYEGLSSEDQKNEELELSRQARTIRQQARQQALKTAKAALSDITQQLIENNEEYTDLINSMSEAVLQGLEKSPNPEFDGIAFAAAVEKAILEEKGKVLDQTISTGIETINRAKDNALSALSAAQATASAAIARDGSVETSKIAEAAQGVADSVIAVNEAVAEADAIVADIQTQKAAFIALGGEWTAEMDAKLAAAQQAADDAKAARDAIIEAINNGGKKGTENVMTGSDEDHPGILNNQDESFVPTLPAQSDVSTFLSDFASWAIKTGAIKDENFGINSGTITDFQTWISKQDARTRSQYENMHWDSILGELVSAAFDLDETKSLSDLGIDPAQLEIMSPEELLALSGSQEALNNMLNIIMASILQSVNEMENTSEELESEEFTVGKQGNKEIPDSGAGNVTDQDSFIEQRKAWLSNLKETMADIFSGPTGTPEGQESWQNNMNQVFEQFGNIMGQEYSQTVIDAFKSSDQAKQLNETTTNEDFVRLFHEWEDSLKGGIESLENHSEAVNDNTNATENNTYEINNNTDTTENNTKQLDGRVIATGTNISPEGVTTTQAFVEVDEESLADLEIGQEITIQMTPDADPITATISDIDDTQVTLDIQGDPGAAEAAADSINGRVVTITVQANVIGLPEGTGAMGFNNAQLPGYGGGRHSGSDYQGMAVTGELGPELWVHDGQPYLTGTHGRNTVFVSEGDQIFTAAQTREILRNNPSLQNIPGFSSGNDPFAGGTSGYTSESSKGSGGGGGNNKGGKDFDPERYHLITRQLKELERLYDLLSKAKDNAYGTNKLDAIQREIDMTNNLIQSQQTLINEIEKYRQEDLQKLKDLGVDFKLDDFGNIANWDELQDKYAEKAQNNDENAKKIWDAIQKYEETIDKMHEAQSQMQDYMYQLAELSLEKIQTKVELVIEIDDREIKFIDHFLNKLNDEVYDVAEALGLVEQKMSKINDQISVTKDGLIEVLKQMKNEYGEDLTKNQQLSIEKLIEMGKTMTGKEIADALDPYHINGDFGEAIEKYVDDLLKYIETLEKLKTEGIDRLDKAFDKLNDNISKSMDLFNYYNDILSTMKNITELQGITISKDMRELGKELNKSILTNTMNELEAERANYSYLQKAVDDLQKQIDAETDKNLKLKWQEELDKAEERLRESNQNILSLIENGLEQARTMFENTLDAITEDYAAAISGMYRTFENMQDAFDRKKELNDFYVDDYEKYYQIAKLQRSINSDLDKAARAGNKQNQRMKDLLLEINGAKENGAELTAYDLDVFAKRYEYEKALMELEDARNNKNEVRLQRDANGNWGYVYTSSADEDDLLAKQQAVDDALYQWQKTIDDQADEIQSTILSTITNIIATANDMYKNGSSKEAVDDFINDELIKLNLYTQKFGTSLNDALKPLDIAKDRYEKETFDALDNYAESVLAAVMDMDLDQIYNLINQSISNADDALKKYQNEISKIDNTGGYKDFINEIIKQQQIIDSASNKTKKDTLEIIAESTETFDDLMAATIKFENEFLKTYQGVIESNENMIKYLLNVLDALNRYEINDGDIYKEKPIEPVVIKNPTPSNKAVNNTEGSNNNSIDFNLSTKNKDNALMAQEGKQIYDWRGIPIQYSPDYKDADPNEIINPDVVYVSTNKGLVTLATYKQQKKEQIQKEIKEEKLEKLLSKNGIAIMDSGGFTGEWGPEGRWAILHQKEQVFNADDTTKLLNAAEILRTIDIQANIFGKGLSGISIPQLLSQAQEIEQNVHIDATFPNVTDHNEIEMAFDNLINKASQYANRKNMSAMTFQDMYTSKF